MMYGRHAATTERPVRPPACPTCRSPLRNQTVEMVLSTNRGYRFPHVLLSWCPLCRQSVAVELDHYAKECACAAHLETDLADHGAVPCEQQLVSVVFESCSRCGQVREVYLNH